jgi:hypothetical protein
MWLAKGGATETAALASESAMQQTVNPATNGILARVRVIMV